MTTPKNSKIYVAGHRGLVGCAIVRRLELGVYTNVVVRNHQELDLLDHAPVNAFLESEKARICFLAAAMVDGIQANNTYPAELMY